VNSSELKRNWKPIRNNRNKITKQSDKIATRFVVEKTALLAMGRFVGKAMTIFCKEVIFIEISWPDPMLNISGLTLL